MDPFLQEGLELTVRRATEVIMEAAVSLSDKEAEQRRFNHHIVPHAMQEFGVFQD